MKFVLLLSVLSALGMPVSAFEDPVHQMCLQAADYQGCVNTWTSRQRNFNLNAPVMGNGKEIAAYDALQRSDKCKVSFFENNLNICGEIVGKYAINKWDQVNLQGCNSVGTWCIGEIHFDILYDSQDGAYGTRFTLLNRDTARSVLSTLTSWSGISQRGMQ